MPAIPPSNLGCLEKASKVAFGYYGSKGAKYFIHCVETCLRCTGIFSDEFIGKFTAE